VVGADQVIALDDIIASKPGTARAARAQLARQAGRTHDLHTAVAVVTPDQEVFDDIVHFRMEMRPLSDEEIAAYVAEEAPLDCAGSYKIESGGIRLFRSMHGDDFTAIIGLPLTRVWSLLEEAGYFSAPRASLYDK
ncbi:MAG: Maf family protein, partial [Bradymonadaceae bacterium]